MPTLTLTIDNRTEAELDRLSGDEHIPVSDIALRLLRRALRERRPKVTWDAEVVRANVIAFAGEDLLLAESGSEERAALLQVEDNAS